MRVQRRANEFQGYFSANDVTRKRETVLNNLGVAYDKFEELNANLTEGYKVLSVYTANIRILSFDGPFSS
jgi:hypothetical protein